jgi:HlyD family secretion protein
MKWWLLLLLIVAAGVWGAVWWSRGHKAASAHTGGAAAPSTPEDGTGPVRVEVVHPRQGGLTRTSTQTGTVHPFEWAELFAKVSGFLSWQEVDIGSRVKKGDTLAVIDDPEVYKERDRAAAAVTQAKAAVVQAQARVETAQADVKAAESLVAKAQSDVARYISNRKYREKMLARYQDLFRQKAVPQQVVDEYEEHYEAALAEERSAEAAVVAAKAQSTAAQAKVDQARADLEEARSNVEVDEAALAKDKVLVDYTRITSPYDGVVTLRTFHVGDFIRSAAEGKERPMLNVARTDKVRVVTYVPDRDVPFVDVGDRAVVTFDALPTMKFEGKVSRYSFSEDPENRTMRTEIDLENPKGLLHQGMYGIATIYLEPDTSRLTIPSSSLVGKIEEGKSSVFVARDGRAHEVPVTIGSDDGIRVEILDGLGPDDEVITSRGTVAEGTPVEVTRLPSAATPGGTAR